VHRAEAEEEDRHRREEKKREAKGELTEEEKDVR